MFTTRAVKDGDEWVINGWKFFSSNAKTASFLIVMAVTNPDVERVPGHVDVPGADRHARRQHRAQRRPRRRAASTRASHALIHYEDVRVPAGGAARRRGPGLRHRPDPPRRRPHPPRHAHHRHGPEGARHDVRAGAEPRDRRAACWPTSSSCRATSPTPTPSSMQFRLFVLYTAWEIDKYNDYQQGAQGHRHGQGGHADGAARHRLAGDAGPRRARHDQRDAVLPA